MFTLLLMILLFLVIIAAIGVPLMLVYNKLVALRNRFKNAFSQIDVQLKRRYDLIPNLVETAKGYLNHESETLAAVINARAAAVSSRESMGGDPTQGPAFHQLAVTDGLLSGAMGRLMAVMENYPDLKANQTIADLMEELRSTENRISFSRQAYNDSVMVYNQAREMFPAVLFASLFGFGPADLWFLDDRNEAEPVKVSFGRKTEGEMSTTN
ncbi:hypothetical protein C4J81_17625 [Deltaproteobacteria bacterium Smac51]|nr:hypothetical protein C4J81_17625 [Deltaproteobacteria bacterium Smac51]